MSGNTLSYKPDDRLTRKQAADYLCISLSRLAQLRREGLIQQEKNASTRTVRYRFSEVEKLKILRETVTAESNYTRSPRMSRIR